MKAPRPYSALQNCHVHIKEFLRNLKKNWEHSLQKVCQPWLKGFIIVGSAMMKYGPLITQPNKSASQRSTNFPKT
jgi:hypothetical protein